MPNPLSTHLDGTTLGVNGSNQYEVKDSGVSAAKLAADAVTTAKIADANVTPAKLSATTGSGSVVLATSASLTTPNLGTPSAVTLTNATGLPVSTGLTGVGTGVLTALAQNVTGAGGIALATSPNLTTPNIGTPTAGTLTNCTGLPLNGVVAPSAGKIMRTDTTTSWVARTDQFQFTPSHGSRLFGGSSLIALSSENTFGICNLNKLPQAVISPGVVYNVTTTTSNQVIFGMLYDTALGAASWPQGLMSCQLPAKVTSGSTTLTAKPYSVYPQDGAAVTVTMTGTGTSRTCTASGGTPFSTSKITAGTSYVQTPKGVYLISARTSNTVVTITVPSAYSNESAVAFSAWSEYTSAAGFTASDSITNTSNYLAYPVIYPCNSTMGEGTAHKFGVLVSSATSGTAVQVNTCGTNYQVLGMVALPFIF